MGILNNEIKDDIKYDAEIKKFWSNEFEQIQDLDIKEKITKFLNNKIKKWKEQRKKKKDSLVK